MSVHEQQEKKKKRKKEKNEHGVEVVKTHSYSYSYSIAEKRGSKQRVNPFVQGVMKENIITTRK